MLPSTWGHTAAVLPMRLHETILVTVHPDPETGEPIPQGVRTAAGWSWRMLLFAGLIAGTGWLLADDGLLLRSA